MALKTTSRRKVQTITHAKKAQVESSLAGSKKIKEQIKKASPKTTSISQRIKSKALSKISSSRSAPKKRVQVITPIIGVDKIKKDIKKATKASPVKKISKPIAKSNGKLTKKSVAPVSASSKLKNVIHDVDMYCPIDYKVNVFIENGKAFDKMLNQSNMDANNNKFYVIQMLVEKANNKKFWVWNRWGRVGVEGQNALKGPMSKDQAIKEYNGKLIQKTKQGNYVEIKIDHGESKGRIAAGLKPSNISSSKPMSKEIRELVKFIFDENMLNLQLKNSGYDNKKMPLGKLSQQAINEGYKVLSTLLKGLNEGKDMEFCKSQSSKFYTLIPHDFGFKKMINFVLDTEDKIKAKLTMLQNLSDMQVATQTNERNSTCSDKVQANYDALDCTIDYVDQKSNEFSMIEKYFSNTRGYYNRMKILDVYRIDKKKTFREELPNRMLLWHGSNIGNYVGILSQGLRIAPPEAPASGYLLGKGIYFADLLEKSANYLGTNSKGEGLILLVDVAMGNMNMLYNHNSGAANLPAGKNSVKCCGSIAPPEKSYLHFNKMNVPLGAPANTNLKRSIYHNEYVVYNTDQATFRYLIKVKN